MTSTPTRLLFIGIAFTGLLAGCGAAGSAPTPTVITAHPTPSAAPTVDAAAWETMMSTDAGNLATALGAIPSSPYDPAASTAIDTLAGDVATMQNDLAVNPAPPQFVKFATTMQSALTDFSTACTDITTGLADNDPGPLAAANTLFSQGNALMTSALAEMVSPG